MHSQYLLYHLHIIPYHRNYIIYVFLFQPLPQLSTSAILVNHNINILIYFHSINIILDQMFLQYQYIVTSIKYYTPILTYISSHPLICCLLYYILIIYFYYQSFTLTPILSNQSFSFLFYSLIQLISFYFYLKSYSCILKYLLLFIISLVFY